MNSWRSRSHGRAITYIRMVAISTVTLSISAMRSRTNMPPNAVAVVSGWPWTTRKMPTSITMIATQWVASRWSSLMNTSNSNTKQAAAVRYSSGTITSRSLRVIMRFSNLAGHQMCNELSERGIHQVHQRPRVHVHRQHGHRERAQHQAFAGVDLGHRRGFLAGRGAPHDALDQPQRVASADDQRIRREQRDPRIGGEAGQDHHELADEARGERQAAIRHREQHP